MGFRNPVTSLSADQITPGTLPPGVILPADQLADGTLPTGVVAQALAAGTVTPQALADAAVTGPKIATGAVMADAIGAGQVFASKIAAGAVDAQRLAVGALGTNLVRNPGFEDTGEPIPTPGGRTNVPGWRFLLGADAGPGNQAHYASTSGSIQTYRGAGVAVVSNAGTGANGGIVRSDPFPVTPGRQLKLSAMVRAAAGTATALVGVYWTTASTTTFQTVSSATANTTWSERSNILTVPDGAISAELMVRNSGNGSSTIYLLVDDLAAVLIGQPAVEITPGGIRMWDGAGNETITLSGDTGRIVGKTIDGGRIIGSSIESAAGLSVYGAFDCHAETDFTQGVRSTDVWTDRLQVIDPPTTTSPASVHMTATTDKRLFRVTSLRRYKLDREPIGLHYELLDVVPHTWRDAGMVEADPDTTVRVPGFVAEDVAEVSTAHGGSLEALLTRDENGDLQGVAYDRWPAYLVPLIADLHARVKALEEGTP